ncbi:hypothetical protein H8959_001475 [Pygathrix nigripes]
MAQQDCDQIGQVAYTAAALNYRWRRSVMGGALGISAVELREGAGWGGVMIQDEVQHRGLGGHAGVRWSAGGRGVGTGGYLG